MLAQTYSCIILLLTSVALSAQSPQLVKVSVLNAHINSPAPVVSCVDHSSNMIYVGGSFTGTLTIGPYSVVALGDNDGFVCAFDETLEPLWIERFGGPGSDGVTCLNVVEGAGVIVGMFCGANSLSQTTYQIGDVVYTGRGNADAVFARMSKDGDVLWSRNEGDVNYEFPLDITQDTSGNIYACGVFYQHSRFDVNTISSDVNTGGFLLKLKPDGTFSAIANSSSIAMDAWESASQFVCVSVRYSDYIELIADAIGAVAWARDTMVVQPVQRPLLMTAEGSAQPLQTRMLSVCMSQTTAWEGDGFFIKGASVALPDYCSPPDFFEIQWFRFAVDEPMRIAKSLNPGSEVEASATDVDVFNDRAIISGSFSGAIDLSSTASAPDAISAAPTGELDGMLILGNRAMDRTRIISLGAVQGGTVRSSSLTRRGFLSVGTGKGSWSLIGGSYSIAEGDIVLMLFDDPVSDVEDSESATAAPEAWDVYDISGRLVSPLPIGLSQISELPTGTYVLHSASEVSLCHVYGTHNVAFAHPAAKTR